MGVRARGAWPTGLWLAFAILLLLTLLSGCAHQSTTATDPIAIPLPVVHVAVVRVGAMEDTLPVTGTLAALREQEAIVSPAVPGVLDAVSVKWGQFVSKGQVIAHLAIQPLIGQIQQAQALIAEDEVQVQQAQVAVIQQSEQTRTAVLEAQASLANAQSTLAEARATLSGDKATQTEAQQDYDREQQLYRDGLVSEREVLDAKLAVQTAASQTDAQTQAVAAQGQTVAGQRNALDAARAGSLEVVVKQKDVDVARQQLLNARGALDTTRAQMALYTLYAPLSGRVTDVGAAVGESVDASTKVATIANLDTLQLQLAVPVESASKLHVGQSVDFQTDSLPGRFFHTTIASVGNQVDTSTGTVSAFARAPNPAKLLQDDVLVHANIMVARKNGVVIIPRDAVLSDPDTGATTVAVVGTDQTVHVQPVTVGLAVGDTIEVTAGGLKVGDEVATGGQYALPDGTKVSVSRAP
jgi:RND family efflux transporter MFP subunit